MEDLFKVKKLKYEDRTGNIDYEAHSKVTAKKPFPIYVIDGREMIFKPLSKTKPLTTPLFAFSEVFWSYVIQRYFDESAPRYFLAEVSGLETEMPKFRNKGVLVESITANGKKMTNLYDYFMANPDEKVNISDYVNYCMQMYDYTSILNSGLFSQNQDLGEKLAWQILLSILRMDENYHYENPNLYLDPKIDLAPPIDYEFSLPFLYPDDEYHYHREWSSFFTMLELEPSDPIFQFFHAQMEIEIGKKICNPLKNNIITIIRRYPHLVLKFIEALEKFLEDFANFSFDDPGSFIGPLNSKSWEIYHAYYKDHDMKKYEALKSEITDKEIDKEEIFARIKKNIEVFVKYYKKMLEIYLIAFHNGVDDLEHMTMTDFVYIFGNVSKKIDELHSTNKVFNFKPKKEPK